MRRIMLLLLAIGVVVTMWTMSAYAQTSPGSGPVGWRWFATFGWVYCDNFYNSDWVYWCYSGNYGGAWFRVDPNATGAAMG